MNSSAKILITGDFCPNGRIVDLINKEYYSKIFNNFLPLLNAHDLNITNLECPLYSGQTPILKSGPNLKSEPKSIELLKFGNFHLVTLANNHIMDHGADGLSSTLDICNNNNIFTVGAGINFEETQKVFYQTINCIKIAIVNFAENEFSTSDGYQPGANPLNPVQNYYSINSARNNADFVLVIIHGGHEYYQLPSPRMQQHYRFFIDAGADAIIGHHTHCYSGYELYKSKPIFYSLGNFLFDNKNHIDDMWNYGFAVSLEFSSNGKFNFNLHPYVQSGIIPGIFLLNKNKLEEFKEKINNLNHQIASPDILQNEFLKLIKKRERAYMSYIEPIGNRYMLALQDSGLLPFLYSKKKRRTLLNIIRCESHRDILIKLLKEKDNENSNSPQ
ncbi:MAG: CapA family protein [Prevotella sp.]|jgi:poly-gamma-glutamate synthesis protein (capsule biosynthesis protein)|nr:CapA family protein [Prevotella sp.]